MIRSTEHELTRINERLDSQSRRIRAINLLYHQLGPVVERIDNLSKRFAVLNQKITESRAYQDRRKLHLDSLNRFYSATEKLKHYDTLYKEHYKIISYLRTTQRGKHLVYLTPAERNSLTKILKSDYKIITRKGQIQIVNIKNNRENMKRIITKVNNERLQKVS